MKNNLLISHINIHSLLSKIVDFRTLVALHKFSVVAVSETWLCNDVSAESVRVQDYRFVRKDRAGRGGGVGLYVHNSVKFGILQSSSLIEQLWVGFCINKIRYAVGVLYRPPHANCSAFLTTFEETLDSLLPNYDHIIALGDFNIDQLKPETTVYKYFSNFLDRSHLCQVIDTPTRITSGSCTLLDLILVSDPSIVHDKGVINMHGLSDHDLIFCSLKHTHVSRDPCVVSYRDFRGVNYGAFYADLTTLPLYYVVELDDIDGKISFLNECLLHLLNTHIPVKTFKTNKRYSPWMTENVKKLIAERNIALRSYKFHNTTENWNYYKSLRNFTTLCIRQEKKAYIAHQLKISDTKGTWKLLRRMNIVSPRVSQIPDNLYNANDVNDYFLKSVQDLKNKCNASHKNSLLNFYKHNTVNGIHADFSFSRVSDELVGGVIDRIKSRATGLDNIGITLVKLCCPYILPIITHIINFCLENSVVPLGWKEGLIIPLPKVTNPQEYGDLRPICILPALSKVLEKVIELQLRDHLNSNPVLPAFQSGFRPGYSCTTALLKVVDDIVCSWDQRLATALVLLDYSKAFDTLDHEILVAMLHFIGLNDKSTALFKAYLQHRTQKVVLNKNISNGLLVASGVPQGSVLGPLLFSIYTSTFASYLKSCQYHCYADDTQLYLAFSPENFLTAAAKMNQDLQALAEISKQHFLTLNPSKSKVLIFCSKANREFLVRNFTVSIDGVTLPICLEAKSLGVILDSDLRMRSQVNAMIRNAYCGLRALYNSRKLLPKEMRVTLCESLILSQFNYCDVLYNMCIVQTDAVRIQRIQNSCLRLIFGIRKFQHISHKLPEVNWLNMKDRRILHSMCLFHSIVKNKSPPYLYNKIRYRTDVHNINIRHKGKLSMPTHKSCIFERGFSYSITKMYNMVDDTLKSLSVTGFKQKLKALMMCGDFR